jgi:hypothetical protein
MPPQLVTIPNVELLKVGTWPTASHGPRPFGHADLLDIVAAAHDPTLDSDAALRIGHIDPRFDGEPALGWVTNVRLSADGGTLVGDLKDVPQPLADVMPAAFRRRSVELDDGQGAGVTAPSGRRYRMRLTGLALLGVKAPAVSGLGDVLSLYGAKVAASAAARGVEVVLLGEGDMPAGAGLDVGGATALLSTIATSAATPRHDVLGAEPRGGTQMDESRLRQLTGLAAEADLEAGLLDLRNRAGTAPAAPPQQQAPAPAGPTAPPPGPFVLGTIGGVPAMLPAGAPAAPVAPQAPAAPAAQYQPPPAPAAQQWPGATAPATPWPPAGWPPQAQPPAGVLPLGTPPVAPAPIAAPPAAQVPQVQAQPGYPAYPAQAPAPQWPGYGQPPAPAAQQWPGYPAAPPAPATVAPPAAPAWEPGLVGYGAPGQQAPYPQAPAPPVQQAPAPPQAWGGSPGMPGASPMPPAPPVQAGAPPMPGVVMVDQSALAALQQGAQAGAAAAVHLAAQQCESDLRTAVTQGRIAPHDVGTWRWHYQQNPVATRTMLAALTPAFPVAALGSEDPLGPAGEITDQQLAEFLGTLITQEA